MLEKICRYGYQIPPGKPNHTCGGADIWADVESSRDVFCSAGSYCPTTTEKVPCSEGYNSYPRTHRACVFDYNMQLAPAYCSKGNSRWYKMSSNSIWCMIWWYY